jgi:indolepyruvate decarboxylase
MPTAIGDFLLRRLEEAGVRHLFGVPGDYNLELLQQLQDTGRLKWIGTCSELNASYAADGYARLNGLGALLVTNGVGALSAINGVGGSYSEHVPVICIAGSIPLRSIDRPFRPRGARPAGPAQRLPQPAVGLRIPKEGA